MSKTWKSIDRITLDLSVTARLTRTCASLLRDHPDEDVLLAGEALAKIATTLEIALDKMPEPLRQRIGAELARYNAHIN